MPNEMIAKLHRTTAQIINTKVPILSNSSPTRSGMIVSPTAALTTNAHAIVPIERIEDFFQKCTQNGTLVFE